MLLASRSKSLSAVKSLSPLARDLNSGPPGLLSVFGYGMVFRMTSAALTLDPDLDSGSFFHKLVDAFNVAEAAKEWSRCRLALTAWEDEHLLIDNPPAYKLERHRRVVERLIFFGQLFALVSTHPDFDDAETADLIEANQHILRDKLRMFHSPMSHEEADRILQEVFPES